MVDRPRVLAALADALDAPVVLLLSPPGGGKTTVLAQLAAQGGWPTAWLRAAEESPEMLFAHVRAALGHSDAADLTDLLNRLEALDDDQMLIIDDYERIDGLPAADLLDLLIANQPPHLKLVLASSVDPVSRVIAEGIVRGSVSVIGPEVLAFQPGEGSAIGWAIAATNPGRADAAIDRLILAPLPADERTLLERTAHWHAIDRAAVAAVLPDFVGAFDRLARRHTLLDRSDGVLTPQPLLRRFLVGRDRSDSEMERAVAAYRLASGDPADAIHHRVVAGDLAEAAALVSHHAVDLLNRDAEALIGLIDRLPATAELTLLRGAAFQAAGRFVEAAAAYTATGMADVAEACRTDGAARVPDDPAARMVRSGHYDAARSTFDLIGGPPATGALHRSPLALRAFVASLLGDGVQAATFAQRALLEAPRGTPAEALAQVVAGHARQVIALDPGAVRGHYLAGRDLATRIGAPLLVDAANLGLALLDGHAGDPDSAARTAPFHSADPWIGAQARLAIAGSYAAAADRRALPAIERAEAAFASIGDEYGRAVCLLWRAIRAAQSASLPDDPRRDLLLTIERHHYDGLLTGTTLFGPRDPLALAPILLAGRADSVTATFAGDLLRRAFPAIALDPDATNYHPGYSLRVQLFGELRIWRGSHEIRANEWGRDQARRLAELLITYRGRWLHREQICALLWPDRDDATGLFKVCLNAVMGALEPSRPPRTPSAYIRRQGLAYRFAPATGCWIDVDEFDLRIASLPRQDDDSAIRNGQAALALYAGDYLAEATYDSWAIDERDRLLATYLATGVATGRRLLARGDAGGAIRLAELVLRRDPAAEEAYQLLILGQRAAGSRDGALRAFARADRALRAAGLTPLAETVRLAERIRREG